MVVTRKRNYEDSPAAPPPTPRRTKKKSPSAGAKTPEKKKSKVLTISKVTKYKHVNIIIKITPATPPPQQTITPDIKPKSQSQGQYLRVPVKLRKARNVRKSAARPSTTPVPPPAPQGYPFSQGPPSPPLTRSAESTVTPLQLTDYKFRPMTSRF